MTGMVVNMNRAAGSLGRAGASKDKGLFNRALIAEGMRRTRTLALIMGIVAWLSAILVPFMKGGYGAQTPILYGPFQINPAMLLYFPVFAPFLTLKAFDFMNSRAGSDLFHSFPVKRRTLAASFLTAVFAWLMIIIGGSILCSAAGCAMMHHVVDLDTSRLGIAFLQMAAASLLVEMSVFLTMTVTGTYLANIVTALGLIFLPRFLIWAAGEMLSELVPMISRQHLPLFFTDRLNIITGLIFGWLLGGGTGYLGPLYYLPSVIYTVLLAVVYAVIGCVLFVRRPSETAGRPALGERLQGATRIGIGFLITVPAAIIITVVLCGQRYFFSVADITELAAFFLAAFGAMFIYEYLSAHRILSWKKLLTGILAVLLLDVLWIAGGIGMKQIYSSEHFDKGRIRSVTFTGEGWNTAADYLSSVSALRQEYWGSKLCDVALSDEKILGLVSLRHEQTAAETEVRDEVEILGSEGREIPSQDAGAEQQLSTLETKICFKNGRTVYRYLTYTSKDLKEIWEAVLPMIGDDLKELPKFSTLAEIYIGDYFGGELKDAYECYGEELEKLTPQKWFGILSDPDSYTADVIQFYSVKDGIYTMGAIPVTREFPKTQKLLDKLIRPDGTDSQEP